MNIADRGVALGIKNSCCDPGRSGSHADRVSKEVTREDESRYRRAVAGPVVGRQLQGVGQIQPAIRSTPPPSREVGMLNIHARIHYGNHDASSVVALGP